jgi:hypothetical protein
MTYFKKLVILAVILLLSGNSEAQTIAPKSVILIGIAGVSADEFQYASTPNIDKLISQGVISLKTRGVMPAESAPNWVSVLSGVGPEQHGVTNSSWSLVNPGFEPTIKDADGYFPSIFQLIRKQMPKATTGMFYDLEQLGTSVNKRFITKLQYVQGQVMITSVALNFITKEKPVFTFICYGLPAETGHSNGFGTKEYYQSMSEIDNEIGKLITGLQEAKMMQNTSIIITSDHGGKGSQNGIESTSDLEVPWIISGPGVQKNALLETPNDNVNTSPTIARILRLKVPAEWIGKPVSESFITKTSKPKLSQYVPKPWCSLPEGAYPGPQQIELSSSRPGTSIYYTLDGSAPGAASKKYTSPFTVNNNCTLKAITISGTNTSQLVKRMFTFVQGIKTAVLTTQPDSKYAGSGVSGLFDGLIGSSNITNKQWLGFEGNNFEVTLDLGEVKPVKALGIDVLKLPSSQVFLPSSVEFFTSVDGINFTSLNSYYTSESDNTQPDGPVMLSKNFDNLRSQFIRIKATNIGTCPPEYPCEPNRALLFVSEVEIE